MFPKRKKKKVVKKLFSYLVKANVDMGDQEGYNPLYTFIVNATDKERARNKALNICQDNYGAIMPDMEITEVNSFIAIKKHLLIR